MRYYFFQTAMIDRGNGPQPTLRALPGQTFEDGTPVDENYNVQAPKEAGTSQNGTRLEYPNGTYFASNFLRTIQTSNGNVFYSVYKESETVGKSSPDFFPVSDDPDFSWVSPQHRNDAMNIAFTKFMVFKEQEVSTDETKPKKPSGTRQRPADGNGKARPIASNWVPRYDDQMDQEANLIVMWLRKVLNEMGIRAMAKRPKLDPTTSQMFRELYMAGESIETIASRSRFNQICSEQKMDSMGLQNIAKGPLEWYLNELLEEHRKGKTCTALMRDTTIDKEVEDLSFLVTTEINTLLGTTGNFTDQNVLKDLKKAIELGWTADEILDPAVLLQKDNIDSLAQALASGVIPLPKGAGGAGSTLIEQLMANKKNEKPKDKDGFHVNDRVWRLLVRNLNTKQHTLLTGPTGSGKTELIRLLCERAGMPLTIIPMGTITDPTEQLIGKLDLDPSTNGTKFDWADFANAIQQPGVILLDEINRCPKNGNNILFSVLDRTATLVASGAKSTDQRNIKVNPNCVFFATANIGYEYTGAYEMDPALKGRFMTIELDYLETKAEATILSNRTGISKEDANNIALIATNIRQSYRNQTLEHSVSTRETIMCAELVRDGFEIEDALELSFLPNFERGVTENDANSERGKVKAMIATRFNNKK